MPEKANNGIREYVLRKERASSNGGHVPRIYETRRRQGESAKSWTDFRLTYGRFATEADLKNIIRGIYNPLPDMLPDRISVPEEMIRKYKRTNLA